MWSTKTSSFQSTSSLGLEASFSKVSLSVRSSYTFFIDKGKYKKGNISTTISASIPLPFSKVKINPGYTYTHNYESGADTHSVFLGATFNSNAKKEPFADIKIDPKIVYSYKRTTDSDEWKGSLSLDLSFNGMSSIKTNDKKDKYTPTSPLDWFPEVEGNQRRFDWQLKHMKLSASFPQHAPYMLMERSAFERFIYEFFGIKIPSNKI